MDERRSDERRPGWWWAYDEIFDRPDLKSYAIVVYCALCRMASQQGLSWPSVPRLAKMTKLSGRSVQRAIQELVTAGLIAKTTRQDEAGAQTSNLYSLLDRTPGGVTQSPPPCQTVTTPVSDSHPEGLPTEGLPTEGLFGLRASKPTETSFDAFWSGYPKKRHKPAARRAWEAVKGDAHVAAIAVGLLAWKGSDTWARGFIEDPATFLRQRQWEDTPDARIEQTAAERTAEIAAALKGKA